MLTENINLIKIKPVVCILCLIYFKTCRKHSHSAISHIYTTSDVELHICIYPKIYAQKSSGGRIHMYKTFKYRWVLVQKVLS